MLQNGACLVGVVLLFIHYIYEKAIVQIIIRADLVLIAPIDILYVCIKRKDTVVHIVRIRSFLILQQTLFGREML